METTTTSTSDQKKNQSFESMTAFDNILHTELMAMDCLFQRQSLINRSSQYRCIITNFISEHRKIDEEKSKK